MQLRLETRLINSQAISVISLVGDVLAPYSKQMLVIYRCRVITGALSLLRTDLQQTQLASGAPRLKYDLLYWPTSKDTRCL